MNKKLSSKCFHCIAVPRRRRKGQMFSKGEKKEDSVLGNYLFLFKPDFQFGAQALFK